MSSLNLENANLTTNANFWRSDVIRFSLVFLIFSSFYSAFIIIYFAKFLIAVRWLSTWLTPHRHSYNRTVIIMDSDQLRQHCSAMAWCTEVWYLCISSSLRWSCFQHTTQAYFFLYFPFYRSLLFLFFKQFSIFFTFFIFSTLYKLIVFLRLEIIKQWTQLPCISKCITVVHCYKKLYKFF